MLTFAGQSVSNLEEGSLPVTRASRAEAAAIVPLALALDELRAGASEC